MSPAATSFSVTQTTTSAMQALPALLQHWCRMPQPWSSSAWAVRSLKKKKKRKERFALHSSAFSCTSALSSLAFLFRKKRKSALASNGHHDQLSNSLVKNLIVTRSNFAFLAGNRLGPSSAQEIAAFLQLTPSALKNLVLQGLFPSPPYFSFLPLPPAFFLHILTIQGRRLSVRTAALPSLTRSRAAGTRRCRC